jgi:hypothetical protein
MKARIWLMMPVRCDTSPSRRFSVGEVATWIPDLFFRSETRGNYRIVATMPRSRRPSHVPD